MGYEVTHEIVALQERLNKLLENISKRINRNANLQQSIASTPTVSVADNIREVDLGMPQREPQQERPDAQDPNQINFQDYEKNKPRPPESDYGVGGAVPTRRTLISVLGSWIRKWF